MSDVSFITDHIAYASTNKGKIVWIDKERILFLSFFLSFFAFVFCLFFVVFFLFVLCCCFSPGADTSHVYVLAWWLCCFHSFASTLTFRMALPASAGGQLRGDKECPFSGVTNSGRVWRKVPESDVWSLCHTLLSFSGESNNNNNNKIPTENTTWSVEVCGRV